MQSIYFVYYILNSYKMSGDYFMHAQHRFAPGMGGGMMNRTQYAFQLATSAHYRQFHEMKAQMPSDVLELFKANDVGFLRAPVKKKCRALDPVSAIDMNLTEMFAIPNLELIEEEKKETKAEQKQRVAEEKASKNRQNIEQNVQKWNPFEEEKIQSNPENTLFVARLNYRTTEKELKFEFQRFGRIRCVQIVRDMEGKSRGYGFVQFENHEDFVDAYKNANFKKINGRKVLVDYQRGRTSLRWRPRRLGGGLGGDFRLTRQQYEKKEAEDRQKRKKQSNHHDHRYSRSRSRSRQKRERRYEQRERDRERERERDRDRQRDRQREREREHRKKDRRSRDRKQKKQKKQKKEKREYIAMRVPADEFKN